MRIGFMVGNQAGMVGMLAALADGHHAEWVLPSGSGVRRLAGLLGIPMIDEVVGGPDVILSVHGRMIVPERTLRACRYGGINVHPAYFGFKGADPIKRWADMNKRHHYEKELEIVAHEMTSVLDSGAIYAIEYAVVDPGIGVERIYNHLYPFYASVVIKALRRIRE